MAVDAGKIVVVGCGPGGPEYVLPAARAAVQQAEIILGSRRLLGLFPQQGGRQIVLPPGVEPALEVIAEHFGKCRVAVLVSGDPGLFSLAKAVVKRFGRGNCEVVAAVGSLQAAFARLALDWSDARILSAHGRLPEVSAAELGESEKIAIFAGTAEAIGWVGRVAQALAASHALFVCENLTLPDEQVRQVEPHELEPAGLSSLTLMIFVRRDAIAEEPATLDSTGA